MYIICIRFSKHKSMSSIYMSQAISYLTYKQFAMKYKIRLSLIVNGKRELKSMKQLANEIYKFETDNNTTIQNRMLYY